jgi:hypothetical protein
MNFEAASKEALTVWMAGLTKLANASGKKMYEDGQQPAPPSTKAPEPSQPHDQTAAPISQQQFQQQQAAAPTPQQHAQPVATHAPAPPVAAPIETAYSPPLLSATLSHSTPAVAAAVADPPAAVATPAASTVEVNGGWIRCTAPDGHLYYYHSGTQTSVWLKPAEYTDENAPNQTPVPPSPQQQQHQQQQRNRELSF